MAENFSKSDVLVTDPPIVEAHRESECFQGDICQERNDNHITKLLFMVRIGRQERVGVFCEVMCTMKLP